MGYWLRAHYLVVFIAIWFFWLSTRPWLICIYSITDLLNCDMPDQSLWSTSQNPLVVPLPNTKSSSDHNCVDILYFRSSTEGRWRSILKFSWNKGSSWFKCQAKFLGPTWTAEEQRYQGDNGTQMVLNSHVVQLVLAFFFFVCVCVACEWQAFVLAHRRWGTFCEMSLSGDERGETSSVRRLVFVNWLEEWKLQ